MTCGIEKVDGLLCKLSFRLLSHYICMLPLLTCFVKHLSASVMSFNNTISKGGGGQKGSKGAATPAPLNKILVTSLARKKVKSAQGSHEPFTTTEILCL